MAQYRDPLTTFLETKRDEIRAELDEDPRRPNRTNIDRLAGIGVVFFRYLLEEHEKDEQRKKA